MCIRDRAESQALVAQLQQENEALTRSIEELEEKITTQHLRAHNQEADKAKLDEVATQHADTQRENIRLMEQLAIGEQEIVRLKEAYTKAVQVCQSLKTRLSSKQTAETGVDKTAEIQQQLDQSEQSLHEAQERACEAERALQSRGSEMRAIEDDMKCAHEENEALKARLREVVSQNEILSRSLQHHEAEQASKTSDTAEMSAHKDTIESMQTQLADQEKNLTNAKQQLEESTKLKDNEIRLVSTAFFEVGLELQKRWKAPQGGKTWLSKRRQMVNQERRIVN
eukprot:TRINITY_DN3587_c0_g1_i1.p1 TRINITY_DN3587_c0_g1~~TRINITY_DN3587_c0_g1_i1.p1  ORF type:complete len:283 (+),score=114.15 TRINITY_DN3587_c0_g1_i1:181-1029(+)